MRAYNQDQRQLFYYDDFLGLTSLTEKLGKNEDQELIRLIRTCGRRPRSKRLILTTRNYLLAQAIEQHELLARSPILKANCVIEMADYTQPVRAQILVNHLWFFGVNETWCRSLVTSGAARKIVDHPNYNPRLIEAMCEGIASEARTAAVFAKRALGLLDDPSSLWRHPYQNQLSEAARELMVCFASLGNGCYLESLRVAYGAFASSNQRLFAEELFNRALRELEGKPIASTKERESLEAKIRFHEDYQNATGERYRVRMIFASATSRMVQFLKLAARHATRQRSIFYAVLLEDYLNSGGPLTSSIFIDHRNQLRSIVPAAAAAYQSRLPTLVELLADPAAVC
jgi:hypothetical protein